MKAHNGEVLSKLLEQLGIKKGKLAVMLSVHRNSITNLLSCLTIPDERLLQIGEAINYDMSESFGRLVRYYAELPTTEKDKTELQQCREDVEYWRNKAYENLELYNKLLVEYKDILFNFSNKPGKHKAFFPTLFPLNYQLY